MPHPIDFCFLKETAHFRAIKEPAKRVVAFLIESFLSEAPTVFIDNYGKSFLLFFVLVQGGKHYEKDEEESVFKVLRQNSTVGQIAEVLLGVIVVIFCSNSQIKIVPLNYREKVKILRVRGGERCKIACVLTVCLSLTLTAEKS